MRKIKSEKTTNTVESICTDANYNLGEDLGTEAIRELQVKDFPAIVTNDTKGNDLYKEGIKKYSLL